MDKSSAVGSIMLFLVVGILLVVFSEKIGLALVTNHSIANQVSWNEFEARANAEIVRDLGVMSFAIGLVERCIYAFRQSRNG